MIIKEFPNSKYCFEFYVNYGKKTFQQIKAETGCYALINLWFYNMAKYAAARTRQQVEGTTDCGVIVNGNEIGMVKYNDWGVCIDDNGCLKVGTPQGQKNYAIGLPTQYKDGKKYDNNNFVPKNGCTHIGFKADGTPVWALASKDKPMTNDEVNTAMLAAGCVDILRYDGSWSSQGDFGDGLIVQPSQTRIVQGYLLAYKRDKQKGKDTMDTNTKLKGIDVSVFQGTIDWDTVKSQIDFAIIQAGYGRNNIDKQFVRNISECNRLGIPCGVYWFSYALTVEDAKREAQYCLAAIKNYKVELPVIFDFEYASVDYAKKYGVTISKSLATEMLKAFCSEVEKAGYFAMMYSNQDFINRYYDESLTQRFALWFATYPDGVVNFDRPPRECGIWQYSSKSRMDGISENVVDMNVSYKDYAAWIKELGLNHIAPDEQPQNPETDEIDAAYNKLKNAGYGDVIIRLAEMLEDRK